MNLQSSSIRRAKRSKARRQVREWEDRFERDVGAAIHHGELAVYWLNLLEENTRERHRAVYLLDGYLRNYQRESVLEQKHWMRVVLKMLSWFLDGKKR